MTKKWVRRKLDETVIDQLANSLELPNWLCRIMAARGISKKDQAQRYLNSDMQQCHASELLFEMDKAVERTLRAIRERQRIVIYGDYDVDGVTSTALLMTVFKALSADIHYFIPNRLRDGYGLNGACLKMLKDQGAALIITVDNGIAAVDEAKEAAALGLDLIITDHHLAGEALPVCSAVINPKVSPDYPYKMLAGVGVAWKFSDALLTNIDFSEKEALLKSVLDLVAIGTICDVAPLDEENRVLVREGIRQARLSKRIGLNALAKVSHINIETVNATNIGYTLGPRINAGGRVGDPAIGVELLLTPSWDIASKLALELDEANTQRRQVEKEVIQEATALAETASVNNEAILVLSGIDWHPGVIGLAASRLVEKFNRPVIVLSIDSQSGIAKGSGRSRKPLNLVAVLEACSSLLIRFGGHEAAAGLSIDKGNIDEFAKLAKAAALEQLGHREFTPILKIDAEINLSDLNADVMRQINQLSPFGMGNPKPTFLARRCLLGNGTRTVGAEGDHLKTMAQQGRSHMAGIAFKMGPALAQLDLKETVDIAFQLEWNEFNGRKELQMDIKDIHQPSGKPLEDE